MGTKYSTVAVSGYNASPPPDDGSAAAINQLAWSKHTGKIGDPLKAAIESVNSKLVTALDQSARLVTSSDTALASDHLKTIQISSTSSPAVTITLSDAATMAAGYILTISNQSRVYTQTITRSTGGDTIQGVAGDITLPVSTSITLAINSAANGYVIISRSTNQQTANVKDFGATGDGVTDDATAIQTAIDSVSTAGGGLVFFPAGAYVVATSIKPKSFVGLIGTGYGSRIIQKASSAIETTTLTAVERSTIQGFRFSYAHATPSQAHMAFQLRSHQNCIFRDLYFDGYHTATAGAPPNDGQTIFDIQPDSTVSGKLSFVFNRLDDIYVEACRVGVHYEGLDGGSTPAPTQDAGTYIAANVISGNVWSNVTLKAVHHRGINAKQWVDSDTYYSFWAQCAEEDVTLIDLNTDGTNWWQVDRLNFYASTLTYLDSAVNDASTVTGIRVGPGTLRNFFYSVNSDKTWNATKGVPVTVTTFFQDVASTSYWISFLHTGESASRGPSIHSKGMGSESRGEATITATTTTVNVTHGLRRAPTAGEVMLTPTSNLDLGSVSRSCWVGSLGVTVFVININTAHDTQDLTIGWQAILGNH